ncbi:MULTISPECIES: cupin [Mycobacterium]|uniref:cupin n=1 Tax=Mycobacterium TaxID=1763 RepID=UPI0007FBA602|nr:MULTISPECIES: cupin [Mycobacterium]OBB73667.1 cupin [Mycobacterium sp. 852014-52144_SCH5372336]OBF95104.1 cupin [Mycobacterium sp. 852002-51152_SCH6134967]VEG43520.1 cupin [Mycolicibacterium flavescens]
MTATTALSLQQLADEQLAAAKAASSGRSAQTVYGGSGRTLRQTVLALTADHGLDDHESPGEATLLVLRGRVQLRSVSSSVEGSTGDYLPIPHERHSLAALEDSAVLLTVVAKK